MNSDRVNAKQQKLMDIQKTLLVICESTAKLGLVTEESAKALESLSAHFQRVKNDLDLAVEMMKNNERSKR